MHCLPGDEHDLLDAFRTMLNAVKDRFPNTLQWTFPPAGVTISEADGSVNGSWADGSPVAALTADGGGTYTNGVGVRVKWTTGIVHNSHHITGSSFLVPLVVGSYEGAGNILDASISAFQSAATTFVGSGLLRIYSRDTGVGDGVTAAAIGAVVPDKVSWLRTRRT